MSPEEPGNLVFLNMLREGNELLVEGLRAWSPNGLTVSWYARKAPAGSKTLGDGVAYIYRESEVEVEDIPESDAPQRNGIHYWNDAARGPGLMLILVLPEGFTLSSPKPMIREVKAFHGRIAVYWIRERANGNQVQTRWEIEELDGDLQAEVTRLNRIIFDAEESTSSAGMKFTDVDEPTLETKRALRQILVNHFTDAELDDLCFDLGIDIELLRRETKNVKARELLIHLDQDRRLAELTELGQLIKPKVSWPMIKVL